MLPNILGAGDSARMVLIDVWAVANRENMAGASTMFLYWFNLVSWA